MSAADGQYALFEFRGALPRARLYTHWEVETNNTAALERVTGSTFDPEKGVLVNGPVPPPLNMEMTNQSIVTVKSVSYSPKDLVITAQASAPSILLLNDRFDPNWQVLVDGKMGSVLRCNYLMRGVYLQPGMHSVEFLFRPPAAPLYVSVAAIIGSILLVGILCVSKSQKTSLASLPARTNEKLPKSAQLKPG